MVSRDATVMLLEFSQQSCNQATPQRFSCSWLSTAHLLPHIAPDFALRLAGSPPSQGKQEQSKADSSPATVTATTLLNYCLNIFCTFLRGSTVQLAADSSGANNTVSITGIDEFGYLRVLNKEGRPLTVCPDGNTFDIMKGLIAMKK